MIAARIGGYVGAMRELRRRITRIHACVIFPLLALGMLRSGEPEPAEPGSAAPGAAAAEPLPEPHLM